MADLIRTDLLAFYHVYISNLKAGDLDAARNVAGNGKLAAKDMLDNTLDGLVVSLKDVKYAVDKVLANKGVMGTGDNIADILLKSVPAIRTGHIVHALADFYCMLKRVADILPVDAPADTPADISPIYIDDLDYHVFFGGKPLYCVADLLDVLPGKIDPFGDYAAFAGIAGKILIKKMGVRI